MFLVLTMYMSRFLSEMQDKMKMLLSEKQMKEFLV